ncbi:MAG TPA: PAS domain S-box protein [Abditibacteriaceae bacterium]|nr:PAS domain S-box protein [Abditibacteriaceae bacterium]
MSQSEKVEQESLIAKVEALETALRENKQRLRAVMETTHEGIWQIDADARTIYVNQRLADMLGYTVEEMQGRSLFDFVDESTRAAVEQNIARRRQGISEQLERCYLRKDGSRFWAIVSTHPIFGEQGEYSGVLAMITDITERKQSEDALRENEERTRFFLSQVPATVWATDADLRITFSQGGGLKDVGLRPNEQVGKSLYDALGSADPEFLPVAGHLRALQGEAVRYETEWRGRAFETHIRPFLAADGSTLGTVGVAVDWTERKRAEMALLASEMRFRQVAESGMIGIGFWNADGRVTDANDVFLEIVGYSRDDMKAGRVRGYDMTPPEYYAIQERALQELQDTGVCVPFEKEYLRKDGSRVAVLAGGSFLDQSREEGVFFVLDITERKRAEAALTRYNERLQILLEIDQAILAARSSEEISHAALSRLQRLVSYQCAAVAHLDTALGQAQVLTVEGECHDKWQVGMSVPIDGVELQEVIQVLASGTPFIIEDMAALSPSDPLFQFFYYEGLVACLITPLLVQDELVGVLGLGANCHGAFGLEARDVAREVANRLAVAMQDASLFEQVRAAHEQLQILSRRLLEAQEMERRHIAHELHDEIGQALTAVKLNLQMLQRAADGTGEAAAPGVAARGESSSLGESIATVDVALQQVRDLSLDLRPSLLDDLGLVAALRWYVDRHARRTGLKAEFVANPLDERPPQTIETACFRVAQEALTNVARHAGAQRIRVEIGREDGVLHLRIQDDGNGFDARAARERAARGESLGLPGMEERARLAGGAVAIASTPGQGTAITATFPVAVSTSPSIGIRESH